MQKRVKVTEKFMTNLDVFGPVGKPAYDRGKRHDEEQAAEPEHRYVAPGTRVIEPGTLFGRVRWSGGEYARPLGQ